MKLTALKTFRHGASTFRRGASVTMSDAQAKPLIAKGLAEETKAATPKKEEAKAEKAAPKNKAD